MEISVCGILDLISCSFIFNYILLVIIIIIISKSIKFNKIWTISDKIIVLDLLNYTNNEIERKLKYSSFEVKPKTSKIGIRFQHSFFSLWTFRLTNTRAARSRDIVLSVKATCAMRICTHCTIVHAVCSIYKDYFAADKNNSLFHAISTLITFKNFWFLPGKSLLSWNWF